MTTVTKIIRSIEPIEPVGGNARYRITWTDGTHNITSTSGLQCDVREHRNVPLLVTLDRQVVTKIERKIMVGDIITWTVYPNHVITGTVRQASPLEASVPAPGTPSGVEVHQVDPRRVTSIHTPNKDRS